MTNKQPRIVEYQWTYYTNLELLKSLKEVEKDRLKKELESIWKKIDVVDLDMLPFELNEIEKDKVFEIAYTLGSYNTLDLIT